MICRYAYWDYYDPSKSYKIKIQDIKIQTEDHVDHEKEFALIGPNKSTIFVAKSKRERDSWVEMIEDAKLKFLENELKLQEQRRKMSTIQPQNLDDKTPTNPNVSFLSSKEQTPTDSSKLFIIIN